MCKCEQIVSSPEREVAIVSPSQKSALNLRIFLNAKHLRRAARGGSHTELVKVFVRDVVQGMMMDDD